MKASQIYQTLSFSQGHQLIKARNVNCDHQYQIECYIYLILPCVSDIVYDKIILITCRSYRLYLPLKECKLYIAARFHFDAPLNLDAIIIVVWKIWGGNITTRVGACVII